MMRIKQLDILRGIAAISVFLGHVLGVYSFEWYGWKYINQSPLRVFWDGFAAVNLFFVLSGCCLSLPYLDNKNRKKINYLEFIVKRLFRIYPAFIVSIILSLVFIQFYEVPQSSLISEWGKSFWSIGLLDEFTLFNGFSLVYYSGSIARNINPPVWSLVVEMGISLILPFIFILSRNIVSYKLEIIVLFSLIFGAIFNIKLGWFFGNEYIRMVANFLFSFYLGILLGKYKNEIKFWVDNLDTKKWTIGLVCGIILYSCRFNIFTILVYIFKIHSEKVIIDIISSLGGFIIVALLFRECIFVRVEKTKWDILGKISYSFYLLHFPILLFNCSIHKVFFDNRLIISTITFSETFILAYIVYILIERPFQKLGQNISKFWL